MREAHALAGNASSVHASGRRAREFLEDARERVARAVGALPREVVFTSGGTEADNHAVLGLCLERGGRLVTTAIEHSAVLAPAGWLEATGRLEVARVRPDARGLVDPDEVRAVLRPGTALASVMHLNNEVGTLQDIPAVAAACREAGVPLHVDAAQSLGAVELDFGALGADLLTLSAHKVHGPKGVGALVVRRGLELPPLLLGGRQEGGRRGGTHNVPGAVGMAVAAERAVAERPEVMPRVAALRDELQARLLALPGVELNGHPDRRGPRHLNVTALDADGEALLVNLDLEGVDASSGSACSAGALEPSHVLLAMGRTQAEARASVRFSLGRATTRDDVELAAAAFARSLERCRPPGLGRPRG